MVESRSTDSASSAGSGIRKRLVTTRLGPISIPKGSRRKRSGNTGRSKIKKERRLQQVEHRVRFATETTGLAFAALQRGDESERRLFHHILRAIERLKANSYAGTQIQKRLIPDFYRKRFNVDNLWKLNLPGGWRLLYWITQDEIIIDTIILEWLPHKEYEKRFDY